MSEWGPSGTIHFASRRRYKGRAMTEDDILDFYERASRRENFYGPHPDSQPSSKSRKPALKIHHQLPEIDSAHEKPNPSNNAFNRPSLPAWPRRFMSSTSITQNTIEPNIFCRYCQHLKTVSRTVQMRPRKGSENWGLNVIIDEAAENEDRFIETFPHHINFQALQKSAMNGCHLCSILAAPDPEASPELSFNPLEIYVVGAIGVQSYEGPGRIEITVRGRPSKRLELAYGGFLLKCQGSLRYPRTNADEVFALANRWLSTCLETHAKCKHRLLQGDFLPTRLLKVTMSGPYLLSLQLCVTSNNAAFSPRPPYLALSHCWGPARANDILKLTTGTLLSFLLSIPLLSLPKTFSDAAIATARLAYTYLWIDSLCIIQDHEGDWAHEAARMGAIYSNATCTLAALGATTSAGGCFTARNSLAFTPCLLRDSAERDCVWLAGNGVHSVAERGPLRPALLRRAWVVQERALAARTLYLGGEMVFWECAEGSASEGEPAMNAASGWGRLEKGFDAVEASWMGLKTALRVLMLVCEGGDWAKWDSLWWKMVQEYTASKLTFDRDKWVAFSGLASAVEQRAGTRLCHGLWEAHLFDELLWSTLAPGRRIEFDAPSWSWLSLDASVREQRFDYTKTFERVATASVLAWREKPPHSADQPARLLIRGPLMRLTWSTEQSRTGKTRYTFRLQNGVAGDKADCDGRWNPDIVPDETWELSTMQFVRAGLEESFGLVVRPVDASRTRWQRVGFYRMYWHSDSVEERDTVLARYFGELETIILS